jgi:hypothetical protein
LQEAKESTERRRSWREEARCRRLEGLATEDFDPTLKRGACIEIPRDIDFPRVKKSPTSRTD